MFIKVFVLNMFYFNFLKVDDLSNVILFMGMFDYLEYFLIGLGNSK